MLDFFQTFIAGCPTSHSRLGHINSAIQVNGRKGLWKFFCRMNPMMDVQCTTFMANLRRYLEKTGFRGLDSTHVDHNMCPTCRMFKYEEDTLVLQRSLLNDEERDHSTIEKLRDIEDKQERLAEKVEEHGRRNEMCRGQIPHALLDSVGGGFNGRMQKNVGFADMVNHECENYFLPDLLRTESTSMLIDLILQRALQCRGEQVLVLVTDCCGSNYYGTLWAFIVYLVDELHWF